MPDENKFKTLTDECYELYTSFKDSGFGPAQAMVLTQEYVGVVFENQRQWLRSEEARRCSKSEILRRYRNKTQEETTNV